MSCRNITLGITLIASVMLGYARPSIALTVFNDGGTHNITDAHQTVFVFNATTVNFITGGSSIGVDDMPAGGDGVNAGGSSIITVNGGILTGGKTSDATSTASRGIAISSGSLEIIVGSVTGEILGVGSGSGGRGVETSGTGVIMTGGTVTGGFKEDGAGSGGAAMNVTGGTFAISGGSLTGGNTSAAFGGAALVLLSSTGSITGGSFTAGTGPGGSPTLVSANGGTLDVSGAVFQSGGIWRLTNAAIVNFFGTGLTRTGTTSGTVTGLLQDGSPININYFLSGGSVININTVPANAPIQRFCDGVCLPAP